MDNVGELVWHKFITDLSKHKKSICWKASAFFIYIIVIFLNIIVRTVGVWKNEYPTHN